MRRRGVIPAEAARNSCFDELYQRHYGYVYAYARRRLGSDTAAEDVVAEVFTTTWRHLSQLPAEPETRLWLTRTAMHAVSNARRSSSRAQLLTFRLRSELRKPDDDGWATSEAAAASAVHIALERLPTNDQEILRLALWEELSHKEIGSLLELSPNAVALRLYRARNRLRALLAPHSPNDSRPSVQQSASTGA